MTEKVFESEYRFLSILWEEEPITSPELVKLCNDKLGWKKSTTYTVIKKLADKGYVKSENTVVSALVTKEEVDKWQSEELLWRTSKGNIPVFLAALGYLLLELSKQSPQYHWPTHSLQYS